MANAVFFFGAGASAPFGIPTMQGMVTEFEKTLQGDGKSEERHLYEEVCGFLNVTLGRPTDLEAVFTVVDSIINWSPDRLGVAALYHAVKLAKNRWELGPGGTDGAVPVRIESGTPQSGLSGAQPAIIRAVEELGAPSPPSAEEVRVARSLEADFERFVQQSCQIRESMSERIGSVCRNLFEQIGGLIGGNRAATQHVYGEWAIFTTNYDAILEHYWLDIVQVNLNTGFQYNSVARMEVSAPERFRQGGLTLFKLHGSITWLLDDRWGLTEQRVPPEEMRTYTGRKFRGPAMLYPIEEKHLYVEPYQTMYLMLNRELAQSARWVVIGYSFGDRIVRDIFERNSRPETNLLLLHPRADEILARLAGFKGTKRPINARFGEDDYTVVNESVKNQLQGIRG